MQITEVVKHLLIINVLMFIAASMFDLDILALRYFESEYFQPFQLVSHFFMHGGLFHLFFNMFALVMFGSTLESRWGPKRFLFFYIVCAFGAVIVHMGYTWYEVNAMREMIVAFELDPSYGNAMDFIRESGINLDGISGLEEVGAGVDAGNPASIAEMQKFMESIVDANINTPMVGASGAIYGLLVAFGMMFPNVELMLIFLPIPIKAKYFIPLIILADLFFGLNQFSWDNIAHFAHLGGALFGFLLVLYFRSRDSGWAG